MENNTLIIKDIRTNEFLHNLSEYYSKIYQRNIVFKANVRIQANDELKLNIYFEKYTNRSIQVVNLTDGDIQKYLTIYASDLGYTLDNYKYIGGIHKTGYFVDEDTPHFDGIRLYLKEKAKTKIKK